MARLIESVYGHEAQIDSLVQLKVQNRWPHAFLFVGANSIGKKKLAIAFAQILICEQADVACGQCGPCLRVEKLQSENLTLIEPDTALAKPVIKVEAIRDLLEALSLSSMGGKRVIIINEAFTMNPQAANMLLKTLEEPFENVFFILIGQSVQQFLSTIRSRTQILRFAQLTHANLKRIKPGLPDWAYQSSRGQVDRLVQMTSNDGLEKRAEAFSFFEQFVEDPEFLNDSKWRLQAKDRSWALLAVTSWLQLICDVLTFKAQDMKSSKVVSEIQTIQVNKLIHVPNEKLLQLSDELIQAEKDISAYLDPVLIFEKMWVKYARVG